MEDFPRKLPMLVFPNLQYTYIVLGQDDDLGKINLKFYGTTE